MMARLRPSFARSLVLGCRAGLLVFLALYTLCALLNMKLGYQGNESASLQDRVWNEFRGVVLGQVGRLILAYSVLGLTLGAWMGAGLWALRVSRRAVFWGSALGCLAVEIPWVLADMAHHPHLYAATLYERAAWTKALLLAMSGASPSAWRGAALLAVVWVPLAIVLSGGLRPPRWAWVPAALATVLALGYAGGRLWQKAPAPASPRPNLLILAADGLRPDHFSGNGYARPTTPRIDQLMREGAQFRETVVQVPRTGPSWATILTSQWAGEHPLLHTLVGHEAREARLTTLATVLGNAGWQTAVVSDYAGDIFSRFPFGFQRVEAPAFNFPDLIRQRMLVTHVTLLPWTALVPGLFPERGQFPELTDPAPLRRAAQRTLEGFTPEAPFALLVFGSSTHFPYAAPAPDEGRFIAPGYRGPWRFGASPRMELPPDAPPPTPEDIAALAANYDAALVTFDAFVGNMLEELERRGLTDSTLVVLLADHGESLAENGRGLGHGDHLWGGEALHVPFVLRFPGRVAEGRTVTSRARSLDVAPTLLELLGVPAPETFRGRSLAPLIVPGASKEELPELPALIETDLWFSDRDGQPYQQVRLPYPWIYDIAAVEPPQGDIVLKPEWEAPVEAARHRGLYFGRWKLLELPTPKGVKVELYDVVIDPSEQQDVAAQHPEVVATLREQLARERPRSLETR
ncbi:sulfatase-like hydrolase/transferase [Stigmatella sp. ncwal1]|uniref:Sulfatase-like hydrolase/transferase n=1 Tax=Stigmatella ashevillensis TaxID=2995309 RepID=A0ABT5DBY9_9BACT|nr:sulfatase-like hydrolase/transferase [Stigmatella ashevillena]MDC0709846.1 sulfatase-like hydrolase/transferase [Stigmatella ashevillena]